VTLCALLTVVLFAARRSLDTAVRTYPGGVPADLWVAPYGVDNLVRSSGLVARKIADDARAVPGVAAADPVLRTFVSAEPARGGGKATLLAIGYRLPDGLGGPPALRAGRRPQSGDEIVVDRAAADRLGVGLGGTLCLGPLKLTVTGVTSGTNLLATQLVFGDIETAARATGVRDRASFVLVRAAPGADLGVLERALGGRLAGTSVLSREAFVTANRREVSAGLLPLLGLLVGLGLAVAAVLVALLAQGLVEERREDIAVLLALGALPAGVGAALVRGVTALVAAGAAAGTVAAALLAIALDRWAPAVELQPRPGDAVVTLALFVAAAAVGASVPLGRLRTVDPLEAFRS